MKIQALRRGLPLGAAVSLGLMASTAQATNGYFANGYGGASKGMAGAGVAIPTGVLGLAQNPAMGLKVGNQAGACLTGFFPSRGFSAPAGGGLTAGDYTSKNPFFLIPCGGVNFHLNDRSTLAFFAFGNGGMNTEYDSNALNPGYGPFSTNPLGVNLEQLFISANLSYQLNDQVSVGIAPILAIQRFSATGFENFAPFSQDPTNFTNNGDSWSHGFGVNLGVLWEPSSNLSFGASYRSRIDMSPFEEYAGLFAEGGDFDIPATATIGLAYTLPQEQRLTLTAEFQRIFYGSVPAIANTNTAIPAPFGADNGPGFGWSDMDVFRVGASFRYSDKLTLRGGVSHASPFAPNNEAMLNIVAPATPQWHLSLGASLKLNDRWGLTTSYTHAFEKEVTGINPALNPTQPVTLRMKQDEFALGLTYRW